MRRNIGVSLVCALFAFVGACADDGGVEPSVPVAVQWAEARAMWHIDRQWPTAWAAWMAIDRASAEGREARYLLGLAEPEYEEVIDQVLAGGDAADQFEYAARIAPMDPELYLPLARAYRVRMRNEPDNELMFIGATEFYRKFLALRPNSSEAAEARSELLEIDPDSPIELPEVSPLRPSNNPLAIAPIPETPSWPLWVALAALVLALAAVTRLVMKRERHYPLDVLAERRPELHPAIAYLVHSLRHELLKHRIGAVGNAVDALRRGLATPEQREFLEHRLFGGEPLDEAWEGFICSFERALGPECDLHRTDKSFRRAGRAIAKIVALQPRLKAGDPRAAAGLAKAHRELLALDAHLSSWVQRLVRTPVDGALFREVIEEVRSEYAAGQVALDEVVIRAPEPAPMVEVFRVDLVLVLKNVVRNAIHAVGRDEAPRRIGVDVTCDVELTGEEAVRIHVRDTSPERFTTEDIYARRMDRGLGLVTAALGRYDGAIAVEDGDDEWAKAVVVRFFRAYAEDELEEAA